MDYFAVSFCILYLTVRIFLFYLIYIDTIQNYLSFTLSPFILFWFVQLIYKIYLIHVDNLLYCRLLLSILVPHLAKPNYKFQICFHFPTVGGECLSSPPVHSMHTRFSSLLVVLLYFQVEFSLLFITVWRTFCAQWPTDTQRIAIRIIYASICAFSRVRFLCFSACMWHTHTHTPIHPYIHAQSDSQTHTFSRAFNEMPKREMNKACFVKYPVNKLHKVVNELWNL